MMSIAEGANVSSIQAYSETAPVVAVWKRWFRPANSITVAAGLAASASSSAGMFSSAETWRSKLPTSARTGMSSATRAGAGS